MDKRNMTAKELIAMNEIDKDALMHHGIKGQKWGVQNGPPYPLNNRESKRISRKVLVSGRPEFMRLDHTISKGTKVYRVSPNQDESLSGHKYVTYLPADRNLYRGGYLAGLKTQYGLGSDAKAYEAKYELTEDLKIPSRDKVKDITRRIMNDTVIKKESVKSLVDSYIKRNYAFSEKEAKFYKSVTSPDEYKKYQRERDSYIKRLLSDMEATYDRDKNTDTGWFDLVVRHLGSSSPIIKQTLIDELRKEGYNAMVDEAGVGGIGQTGREGIEPLIIFNGQSSMNKIGQKEISKIKENNAAIEYTRWKNIANNKFIRSKTEW